MVSPNLTPEQKARQDIDAALERAGWVVQNYGEIDLDEARGVAVREFVMQSGHGFADYLLFVDPHLPRPAVHRIFPGRKQVPKTVIFAKDVTCLSTFLDSSSRTELLAGLASKGFPP